MTAEQLVDLVLSSAHPRLQERCSRNQIVNLLQEKHAAYDAHGVHSLLARTYDAVEEQLGAASRRLKTVKKCPVVRESHSRRLKMVKKVPNHDCFPP